MPDQPRPDPLASMRMDVQAQMTMLQHGMAAELRHVENTTTRQALSRVREVAIAMANVQHAPDRWEATGESILAGIDSPNTGHLVASMALYMSRYPANSLGALHILEHAAEYILYISRHTRGQ